MKLYSVHLQPLGDLQEAAVLLANAVEYLTEQPGRDEASPISGADLLDAATIVCESRAYALMTFRKLEALLPDTGRS